MQKLLSWTISRKMWLLTIFLLFNLVVVGGIAYQSPRGLIRKINELANIQLPAVRLMTLTDMMHDGIRASVYSGFLAAENYDVGSLKEIQEELQGFSKDIRAHVEGLKELDLDPELKSKIAA
ncbi:MAG: hypothetical protein NTX25_18920, partial [Proteobacteria bacterium]|nr:hypothetical protein [Pseudomonadota bacterium]